CLAAGPCVLPLSLHDALPIFAAAGAAVGLTEDVSTSDATSNAESIGLGGAIALLVVLMIAYYCGGYVAGRMSRFDGARQGFGARSEEHTSELQSRFDLVCRLL